MVEQSIERDQVLQALAHRFEQDSEAHILPMLMRAIADPLKPVEETGRMRLSPVAVTVFVLGLIAVCTFLYFGYWA